MVAAGSAGVPRLTLNRATGFWARLRGLHAWPILAGHSGLWLHPCNAVHSFGLGYEIDLVFLDARREVLKTVHSLASNRVAFCLFARSVVELPAGYCKAYPGYPLAISWALVE